MTQQVNLLQPSVSLVKEYLKKFANDERYSVADDAIVKLITQYSDNNKLEHVLLKAVTINTLYSTNVLAIFEMAKYIHHLKIDKAIQKGDYSIVHKIAQEHSIAYSKKTGNPTNFYSFATKYCSWHNLTKFPIYDYFASKVIAQYNQQYKYVEKLNLKDYPSLVSVITAFQERHGLQQFSFKEIDKFLWILGKEKFPKK